jgi:hypothetical protein
MEEVSMTQVLEGQLPVVIESQGLMPILDIETFQLQLKKFQEFVQSYLTPGTDFGKIPGTDKDTLLKPGAEKLCEIYGFYADYSVMEQVENWDKEPPLFDYTIKCVIKRRRDDAIMGSGLASCNSYEGKYRWRNAERICPECGKSAIIKGKKEYGGGWLCFAKKGGCGAKFADGAPEIMEQETGKIPNEDIATQKNTVLKMAQKRALVGAVIAATRSSGIFTQDIEDFTEAEIKVTPSKVSVSTTPKESIAKSTESTESPMVVDVEITHTGPGMMNRNSGAERIKPVTKQEMLDLFNIGINNGFAEEDIDSYLKQTFGITEETALEITRHQYNQAMLKFAGATEK